MSSNLNKQLNLDQESESAHESWLVSFGDLLTLLLCFFISSISLSPFGKSVQVPDNISVIEGSAESQDKIVLALEAGKPFADTKQQLTQREFGFSEMDFTDNSRLNLESLNRLKAQAIKLIGEYPDLEIQTCAQSELGSEQNWNLALLRMEKLRGQLIDSGIYPKSIRYEVLGTNCQILGNDLIAKIKFK